MQDPGNGEPVDRHDQQDNLELCAFVTALANAARWTVHQAAAEPGRQAISVTYTRSRVAICREAMSAVILKV